MSLSPADPLQLTHLEVELTANYNKLPLHRDQTEASLTRACFKLASCARVQGSQCVVMIETGSRWAEAEEPDFTLRQLVEDFASEHSVAFLPKPGRSERGLQVTT